MQTRKARRVLAGAAAAAPRYDTASRALRAAGPAARPRPGRGERTDPDPEAKPWRAWIGGAGPSARTAAGGRAGASVEEGEPNDAADQANVVALGDDVSGVVAPSGDVDWFAVDLTAGVGLDVEVVASRTGSSLDSYLILYAPDGSTVLRANDDAIGLDSRIEHTIVADGRYFVALRDLGNRGGAAYGYTLRVREYEPSPGDPTTLYASGLGSPWTAAAAPDGVFYVVDWGGRIVRASEGQAETVVSISSPTGAAIDGFGNVLVSGWTSTGDGVVTLLTPEGETSELITDLESAASVTVGPDGDIWVADPSAGRIHRFGPRGAPVESIDVSGSTGSLVGLAFSPSGVLHWSDYSYRICLPAHAGRRPRSHKPLGRNKP